MEGPIPSELDGYKNRQKNYNESMNANAIDVEMTKYGYMAI